MKENFDKALARVLVYEGGLVRNPHDPGGRTNFGITQSVYNNWRKRQKLEAQSVARIAKTEVATIYRTDYWNRIHGDELPAGMDFCLFDAAVNSGVGGAAKWTQGVLNLVRDGDFGPKTMAALLDADPEDFINEFCKRRLGTLQRSKNWKYFGKGWAARIANVLKTSLAWADTGAVEPEAAPVHTAGGHAKMHPSEVPTQKNGSLITHLGTLGGVIITAVTTMAQQLAPTAEVLDWMKYVLAALTITGAIAGVFVFVSKWANDSGRTGMRDSAVDENADLTIIPITPAAPNDDDEVEVIHG